MIQTLGWISTIMFTVCYIPQILKIVRSKKIDGISVSLFAIQFVANIVALVYAIDIHQTPLIIKYIMGLIFVGVVLLVYRVYNQKQRLK